MSLGICTPNVTLPHLLSIKCRIHSAAVLCQLLVRHTGRGSFLSCNSWLFRPLFGSGGEGGMLQQTSASFALDRVRLIHSLASCWCLWCKRGLQDISIENDRTQLPCWHFKTTQVSLCDNKKAVREGC